MERKAIVSYIKDWDNEGCCYTQRVRIKTTRAELDLLNAQLNSAVTALENDKLRARYLSKDLPIKEGLNYLNHTQLVVICAYLSLTYDCDKVKYNYNTVLKIEIEDEK